MMLADGHSPELVSEINSLTNSKENVIENLLGFSYLWNDDSITASLMKIIVDKNCKIEKGLANIISGWFQVNGYHVISNSHILISQRHKIFNNLLKIIKSLSCNQKNTELAYNLKLYIIRNSRLNPISKSPNFIVNSDGTNKTFNKRSNSDRTEIQSSDKILANSSPDRIVEIISLVMTELFLSIVHKEFVNCQWMKSNGRETAPTIYQLIDFTNFICARISTEILQETDEKERSLQILRAIKLAKQSLDKNNYELLSAIIAALNSAAISRLKKAWDLVPKKHIAEFDSMNEIVTPLSNYSNYRSRLESLQIGQSNQDSMVIPILAVVLKDIAANDVLSNYNDDDEINTNKLSKFGKIIYPIFQLQTQLPSMVEIKQTHTIENVSFFNSMSKSLPLSDNYLLKLSYDREMPKDTSLITELNESFVEQLLEKSETKLSALTIGEKAKLLRQTANKNPNQWNAMDIKLNLELWGFSVDLADQLVDNYIPNASVLFEFQPNASTIPYIGLRKALLRHVKELKDLQLLIDTYGSSFVTSNNNNNSNSSSISPLSSLDSSTDETSSSKYTSKYFLNKNIVEWDSMDVSKWISHSNLPQYESNFQSTTGEALLKMTDSSLTKVGVAVMGHRKSIMREVNKLKMQQTAQATASKKVESKLPISKNRRMSIAQSQKVNISYMHSF